MPGKDENDIGVHYNPDEAPPESRIAQVRQEYETRLMGLPGVTGVGQGRNAVGDEAIIVYLKDKAAVAGLPKQVGGIEIVTMVTGIIEAQ